MPERGTRGPAHLRATATHDHIPRQRPYLGGGAPPDLDLAAAHGAILYPNFLAGLGDRAELTAAGPLMQPDGLHPNAEGVKAVVAAIGPAALELVRAAQQD